MARQNLFERMQRKINFEHEYSKIDNLICYEKAFLFTINDVFAEHFLDWKYRSNYLSFQELRDELGFNINNSRKAHTIVDEDRFFQYCELVFNLYESFESYLYDAGLGEICEKILHTMLLDLEMVNFTISKNSNDIFLVVEKDRAVTAVAEICTTALADQVIEYNHYLLRGEPTKKKAILLALADELEPRRQNLERLSKGLSSQLFFLFNNANIRHNNVEKGKNYKQVIADMGDAQLEELYDETYQMALLAILLLDNAERSAKISELMKSMSNS